MDCYRVSISANSDISSLISGKNNGVISDYLITGTGTKKDCIIYCAGKIKENFPDVNLSIYAKFKYSFREAKIEIAFFYSEKLFLFKIVKKIEKTDQELLKLDRLISAIKNEHQEINIIGCILVTNKIKFINIFKEASKLLKNNFILLSEEDIIANKINFL